MRCEMAAFLSASLLLGCAAATTGTGRPPNPTRLEPPPGVSERALAVDTRAPEFTLPMSTGGTWSLRNALRDGPVVLLFYRGDW
jgi:hypothetical protein